MQTLMFKICRNGFKKFCGTSDIQIHYLKCAPLRIHYIIRLSNRVTFSTKLGQIFVADIVKYLRTFLLGVDTLIFQSTSHKSEI